MNHNQIEKTNMYKKVDLFFKNPLYVATWKTFNRLDKEVENFNTLNVSLTGAVQQHQTGSIGVTRAKNEAFATMIGIVVNKAQKAFVWALDTGDEKLQYVFDVSKTDFTGVAEIKAYNKAKIVRDSLGSNIASMESVQLTQADLDQVNDAISAYEAAMGTPGAALAHKTSGTKGVEDLIGPIDKSLEIIDKLMESSFSDTQPEMVKEYFINRAIDKLPVHHSGVAAQITDAATGSGLEGAKLAVNGKSAISDIDGLAEIIKMKPGTYNAIISFDGYATQTIKIVVERGKITGMDVDLVKE